MSWKEPDVELRVTGWSAVLFISACAIFLVAQILQDAIALLKFLGMIA